MSVEVTLKNINYFLSTVLHNAFFSAGWDEEKFQNALHWALYCEKVYQSTANKKFADELDGYIKQIATSIPCCVAPRANLLFLKKSSVFLKQAFLQNPYLNKEMLCSLIDESIEKDNLEQDLTYLAQLKSGAIVMLEWMEHDLPTDNKCHSLWKEIKADLLLNHIWKVLSSQTTKEENETFLSEFLHSLTTSEEKLEIFMHLLALEIEITNLLRLQSWMLDWLLKNISQNSHDFNAVICKKVWTLSPHILCLVSGRHFLFYKEYINMLTQYGNVFEPDYGSSTYVWKPRLDSPEMPALQFKNLVQHFRCLLCASKDVSNTTELILKSLATNSNNCCLWQSVLEFYESCRNTDIIDSSPASSSDSKDHAFEIHI